MIFGKKKSDTNVDHSKRSFLRGKQRAVKSEFRLPWITDEKEFLADCTKCGICIEHCEEKIIVKSEDGFPKIDFSDGECTFCEVCIDKCPQTFFKEDRTENAWPSKFNIKDDCLAKNKVYCQSCKDVCDTRAINFKFIDGSIPQPVVTQDLCNGCGACIKTCPTNSTELILFQENS